MEKFNHLIYQKYCKIIFYPKSLKFNPTKVDYLSFYCRQMSLQFDVRFFEVFIDHHYFKVRIKSHNYFNTEVLEHKWGFFIFTKYGSMKTVYKKRHLGALNENSTYFV